ncbi:MAG: OmpA family protein [Bacteroidota bacterium]
MKFKTIATWICIYMCISAQFAYSQTNDQEIQLANLGSKVNSRWADFSPVINADASILMFTSRRPVTKSEMAVDSSSLERIFMSKFDKQSNGYTQAEPLGAEINDAGRNNSAIALSNDGQSLLIYRDDDNGNGDIWESKLSGSKWSKAKKLPAPINSPEHESTACYSPDGNTVYFISQRKGGVGGRDIWSCKRKADGTWGDAINLGSVLNTSSDEEGVFIHPDGVTMYFSSKAHGSRGGYDLFVTKNENGKWSVPQNMSSPLNSTGHDVFFVLDASATKGFYTSAADGGLGSEDLYLVTFVSRPKEEGPRLTLLKGRVYDEKSGESLEAKLEIINNVTGEKVTEINSNSATGSYMVSLPGGINYGISVTSKGYLFNSVNVNMPDTTGYTEVEKDVPLKRVEVGTTIVLNNIFYDFDKSTLRDESKSELNRLAELLLQQESIKIELGSHTDSKGTEEYNMRLSQARAQSVVDYLASKGVALSRLVAKGYGESKPISSNETDEGRQLNRRTEFSILSK